MTNKLKKIMSGALAVVMLLGFCPVLETEVQAVSEEKKPVIHLYADSDNDKQAVEEKAGTSLLPLNTGTNATEKFSVNIWHFSGGYWDGTIPRPIQDSEFEQTEGHVANIDDVLKVGTKDFNYSVPKGTPLYEALKSGEDVYINIKPNQEAAKDYGKDLKISLSKMFAVDTVTDKNDKITLKTNSNNELDKITCRPEETANGYNLVFTLPLKLNYHPYRKLGFNDTYGLNLNKSIPIPKNGYGEIMFSMWKPDILNADDTVQKYGVNIGTSKMWVNEQHPMSLAGMPKGRVHPTMIRPYNKLDAWGKNTVTTNMGGLLYDKVPVGTKDPVTGKTILTPNDMDIDIRVALEGHKDYGNDIPYNTTDWNIGKGTFANGGAVGIYFHYDLAFDFYVKPKVKVVASYVELTDLTEVGSSDVYIAQYKTLCESELLSVPVHDNIVSIPLGTVMTDKNGAQYDCISNDFVISSKDLGEAKNIQWYEGYTPQRVDKQDKLLEKTIKYYFFGLVTSNPMTQDVGVQLKDVANKGSQTKFAMLTSNLTKIFVNINLQEAIKEGNGNVLENNTAHQSKTNDFTINEIEKDVIYVRYICVPKTMQRNKINIYGKNKNIIQYINVDADVKEVTGLTQTLGIIPVKDATIVQWWTADNKNIDFDNSIKTKQGTDLPNKIEDVSLTDDIFVEWEKHLDTSGVPTDVPEWRLSKYKKEVGDWKKAEMWMNLTPDVGHRFYDSSLNWGNIHNDVYEYKNVGPYRYNTINPTVPNWLQSKMLTKGNYTITHSNPSVQVFVNGTVNAIKSSDLLGISVAKWVKNDESDSLNYDLNVLNYALKEDYLPTQYIGSPQVIKKHDLTYGIKNKDTYKHYYSWYFHEITYCDGLGCNGHDTCKCGTSPETLVPQYLPAEYSIQTTFDRYKPVSTDKNILKVPSVSVSTNGYTTLKYQPTATLNVYPEVGMLLADDVGAGNIQWVVGEQARKISPVVYQTLDYKVSVNPKVTTTTMSTDSRIQAGLSKLGLTGKDSKLVIPKGSPVNTNFSVNSEKKENDKGIITVKTYALDMKDTVKNTWGNSGYNSKVTHDILKGKVANQAVTATSKILVDSPAFGSLDYTGATLTSSAGKYTFVADNTLTHDLIVRGGVVIGVKREGKAVESMDALKISSPKLYTALIEMNLYNEGNDRSNTVFKTFEYQKGNKLTETDYVNFLSGSRKMLDGILTPNFAAAEVGKGWYSEDTTVLQIKEYSSNYLVSSPTFNDKLAMSVPGLTTPVNKNLFYSVMGKGYSYLKMNLPLTGMGNGAKDIDVYFEYSGYPQDDLGNGSQQVQFVVPNVSVLDATRVN